MRRALGDFAGAVADLDEAIRRKPEAADARSMRGRAKLCKGDYAGAIADATEALRLKPDRLDPLIDRALARALSGERAAAVPDLEKAAEAFPEEVEVAIWIAAFGGGTRRLEAFAGDATADFRWPSGLACLFLGRLTGDQLVSVARQFKEERHPRRPPPRRGARVRGAPRRGYALQSWDVGKNESAEKVSLEGTDGPARFLVESADRTKVAVGTETSVLILNRSAKFMSRIAPILGAPFLAIDPDGKGLVLGSGDLTMWGPVKGGP